MDGGIGACPKMEKKRNRSNIYWRVVKVFLCGIQCRVTETFLLKIASVLYNIEVLKQKNCT